MLQDIEELLKKIEALQETIEVMQNDETVAWEEAKRELGLP